MLLSSLEAIISDASIAERHNFDHSHNEVNFDILHSATDFTSSCLFIIQETPLGLIDLSQWFDHQPQAWLHIACQINKNIVDKCSTNTISYLPKIVWISWHTALSLPTAHFVFRPIHVSNLVSGDTISATLFRAAAVMSGPRIDQGFKSEAKGSEAIFEDDQY